MHFVSNNQSLAGCITRIHFLISDPRASLCIVQMTKKALKFSVLFILTFFFISVGKTQSVKPSIVLSQIEMTPLGGQPYDEFYWLNSNNAALIKTNAKFLTTGSYRVDVSAYSTAGTPIVNLLIDGVSKGGITVNTVTTNIFSLSISNIPSGAHTIKLQLSNFNSGNNHVRIGLIYFSQTTLSTPYVYPAITSLTLARGKFLQANHFGSGKLRGFNLDENGTNQTNANGGSVQSMIDMKATGANIARCFVSVTRSLNSNSYQLKPDALQKLDTTVQRAARFGFYIIPCLYLDPKFNGGQGNIDLWGPTSLGPNQGIADDFVQRRNSVVAIWKFLANRYKNNTWVGAYDLWNEPRSLFNYALYLRWQQQIIDSIRIIDQNHVVAVECIKNDMFAMMLPFQNSNIIYSPHGYSSLKITHQGLDGTVRNKYPTLVSTADLNAPFGKTELSKQHDDVRTMSHRFHVPIFIGEFSCINWSPLNDAGEWTSTKWTDDNISLLEAERWSWVYHAWREWTPWESEIPSQWYVDNHVTYTNGHPSSLPPTSARTSKAPTIVMLKKWFRLNDSITIIRNIAPTILITSPAPNGTFAVPASLTMTAEAADSDGTIAKVEFYNGNILQHTEYLFPYSYAWHNIAAGNYTIIAKAYDNAGAWTASPPVTFSVSASNIAPMVSITSPLAGVPFNAPASSTITAYAADADGILVKWNSIMEPL